MTFALVMATPWRRQVGCTTDGCGAHLHAVRARATNVKITTSLRKWIQHAQN